VPMRIMSIMSRCIFSFHSSHHVYHLTLYTSVQANQAFAARLASVLQPGDLVWVHDYHLLLVPRMLRNAMHLGAVNGMGTENSGDV
jgi:trehalose-6-phosphate synthase